MKLKYLLFAFIFTGLIVRTFQLQHEPFSDWDEGIFAGVAADMITYNSYILPTFNDELYLDKPPLTSILTAVGFLLFPEHKELASRMMMTFAAMALLYVVYVLSKRIVVYFFSRDIDQMPDWQRELLFFTPVFSTALTPVFLDRAVRLNTDSILALAWLCYFLAAQSFPGKLFSVLLGVWVKSAAGFYPMIFDTVSYVTSKEKRRQTLWYISIILVAMVWFIISYVAYGNEFITAHIRDQLFKRVTVPIELHFGGRLFYPEFLAKELTFILVLVAASYAAIAWDMLKKMRSTSWYKVYEEYKLLLAPLPFFVILTYAKSKIWWYMILLIPFFALTIPYVLMKIKQKQMRLVLIVSIAVFFLYRFLPQTYLLAHEPSKPDKLSVARCVAKIQSDRVLIMVNEQERKNRNVVEAAQLQTSSSFNYGGSPAFIYYSEKHVEHYYRVDEVLGRLLGQDKKDDILVISKEDLAKEEFKEVRDLLSKTKKETTCYFGEWEVYHL